MTAEPTYVIYPTGTLGDILGFEHIEMTDEFARGRFEVARCHMQPFGLVHGGAFAALAEGLTSETTLRGVARDGMTAQGMNSNLNFFRPILGGTVHAEARRRHRGRTTWVWDVDITDDEGRLCATARLTIAIRPAPPELREQLIARSGS